MLTPSAARKFAKGAFEGPGPDCPGFHAFSVIDIELLAHTNTVGHACTMHSRVAFDIEILVPVLVAHQARAEQMRG